MAEKSNRPLLEMVVKQEKGGHAVMVRVPGRPMPDDTGHVFPTEGQALDFIESPAGTSLLARFSEKYASA
jgi:hypothetical protein